MPTKTPLPRLTHFLCIPIITSTSRPQLQKSFQAFRTILNDEGLNSEIPHSAIRPLGTLHLTLGVMSLLTPERVAGALALLHSLDLRNLLCTAVPSPAAAASTTMDGATATMESSPHEAASLDNTASSALSSQAPTITATASLPAPLPLTIRGLHSMHAPMATSVLYASPSDPSGRLHAFSTSLRAAFVDFLVPDDRPLLLHATIVNTIYVPGVRKSGGGAGQGHGKRKARLTFDARDVLERFGGEGWVWMEGARVEKVGLWRMGSRKIVDEQGRETAEEEYSVEGEVVMPYG